MEFEINFYIANKEINKHMNAVDMTNGGKKVFITGEVLSGRVKKMPTEKKLLSIIEKSKINKDFWFPAISVAGNFFVEKIWRKILN